MVHVCAAISVFACDFLVAAGHGIVVLFIPCFAAGQRHSGIHIAPALSPPEWLAHMQLSDACRALKRLEPPRLSCHI